VEYELAKYNNKSNGIEVKVWAFDVFEAHRSFVSDYATPLNKTSVETEKDV
jgi:hypothetical protein